MRGRRRALGAVAVLVMSAVLVLLWWSGRDSGPRLGRYGPVSAVVADHCMHLTVEVDGLLLRSARRPLPARWRGTEVDGTLVLTGGEANGTVDGTFTARDGTEAPVQGGWTDGIAHPALCADWADADLGG